MKITQKLYQQYKNGELSPREIQQFEALIEQHGLEILDPYISKDWSEDEDQNFSQKDEEELWKSIEKRLPPKKINNHFKTMLAASLVLFMLASGSILWYHNFSTSKNWVTTINNNSTPKLLTLSDNSTVWLSPKSSLSYPKKFNNKIRKNKA